MKSVVKLVREPAVTESDLGRVAHFTHTAIGSPFQEEDDEQRRVGLAVACFRLKHMSVFEFADLTFDVTCPIYVARQLVRHRNGTFMEKSLRSLEPLDLDGYDAYTSDDDPFDPFLDYRNIYAAALKTYRELIEAGERKERARAALPLGTPTEFLWRISLRSLFNVFDQRLHPAAQEETRAVVQQMYDLAEKFYPNVLKEWKKDKEGAKTEQ